MDNYYVYVLDKEGNPLMPTKRYGWVRRALKSGRAVPVQTVPFTIRLTYSHEEAKKQEVRLGIDPGRTNIGLAAVREDGKCLYRAKCTTRNKQIPILMGKRKMHRQASRRGERLARKRIAKRLNTTLKHLLRRKLPGYKDGFVTVKDIINTEAKFNNRKRPEGWLTPTARQLLQTHENLVRLVQKILPITSVACEINKFDFQKMENPKIRRWEYGKGPLYGYGSEREAVMSMQNGRCILCGEDGIEHVHHLKGRSRQGSNTIANLVGLCGCCHEKIHHSEAAAMEMLEKKKGVNKKYHALSVLNQIINPFFDWLGDELPGNVYAIQGWDTKAFRDENAYDKDHDVDAYSIACSTIENSTPDKDMPPCHEVQQFRRHDRAIINSQTSRSYFLNGKKVAQNRNQATDIMISDDGKQKEQKQKLPALSDWFEAMCKEYGLKEAERMRSALKVAPAAKRRNEKNRILPGAVFWYQGKRYVKKGQLTNGAYMTAVGQKTADKKDIHFPTKECTVYQNRGLVYAF